MKKHSIVLAAIFVLALAGCAAAEGPAEEPGEPAPAIILLGQEYRSPHMPVDELPEGYEYVGTLSEEAANGTGLEGCEIYANLRLDSLNDVYLYQECGTPIGDNTVDTTKLQWAYVQWVLDGGTAPAAKDLLED